MKLLSLVRLLLNTPQHKPFSLLLALLLLSGCNPKLREALTRASEAEARGDFRAATQAYRDACRQAPDDTRVCTQADLFAQKATAEIIATARPACDAGELDKCLSLLLDTRDFVPDHSEILPLYEKVSQLHTERCTSKWNLDGPLHTAVAGFACLGSRDRQLPVPRYKSLVTENAKRLASRFTELAATAEKNPETVGAAAMLWTTAQCLVPDVGTAVRLKQTRQEFLQRTTIPVTIELSGSIPPQIADGLSGLCKRLSSKLPTWARCAETGTDPDQLALLHVQVDATIQQPQESISGKEERIAYSSGVKPVLNPGYAAAEMRLADAEMVLRPAARKKEEKDGECEKLTDGRHEADCVNCPKRTTPCDEAETLAKEYASLLQKRNEALSAIWDIAQTTDKPTYREFYYQVQTHHWSSSFHFTIQSNNAVPLVRQEGTLDFHDTEHPGLAAAKLKEDPLTPPTYKKYSEDFLEKLEPRLVSVVRVEGELRGSARRAQCKELPADWNDLSWLQCWTEASHWESNGEPNGTGFLQLLATSAAATESPRCR